MPRNLTSADLRRLADELDRDDERVTIEALRGEVEELKGRKPSREEIIETLAELSDEERDELGLPARERERVELEVVNDPPPPAPDPDPDPEPKVKKRPGRRSGTAYSWTVNEEGEVEQLEIPRIYQGPDEPDEVEIPAPAAAEEEEAAA